MAQTVFKVFDKDSSGSLDFMEYMQASNPSSVLFVSILVAGTAGTPAQYNRGETGLDILGTALQSRAHMHNTNF